MSVPTYYRFEVMKGERSRVERTIIEYVWAASESEARDKLKARLEQAWGVGAQYRAKWTRTTDCPGL